MCHDSIASPFERSEHFGLVLFQMLSIHWSKTCSCVLLDDKSIETCFERNRTVMPWCKTESPYPPSHRGSNTGFFNPRSRHYFCLNPAIPPQSDCLSQSSLVRVTVFCIMSVTWFSVCSSRILPSVLKPSSNLSVETSWLHSFQRIFIPLISRQ